MSERTKSNLLKYGISGIICLALAAVYCFTREFSQMDLAERYRTLCDAFTIPAVVALCGGFLVWASNDGAFYGLTYCVGIAWKVLLPGGRHKIEKYYDYVMRRKEKKITGFGFVFVVGGVCMAIALVFLILFYQVY